MGSHRKGLASDPSWGGCRGFKEWDSGHQVSLFPWSDSRAPRTLVCAIQFYLMLWGHMLHILDVLHDNRGWVYYHDGYGCKGVDLVKILRLSTAYFCADADEIRALDFYNTNYDVAMLKLREMQMLCVSYGRMAEILKIYQRYCLGCLSTTVLMTTGLVVPADGRRTTLLNQIEVWMWPLCNKLYRA